MILHFNNLLEIIVIKKCDNLFSKLLNLKKMQYEMNY